MLENTIKADVLGKIEQFQLNPFSTEDSCEYVQHRLVSVGYQGDLSQSHGDTCAVAG